MRRWIWILLAAGRLSGQASWDLLLTGGTVIDPKNGLAAPRRVAIAQGRIAAVGERLPEEGARRVVAIDGLYLVPGLIDLRPPAGPSDAASGVTAHLAPPPGAFTPRLGLGPDASEFRFARAVPALRAGRLPEVLCSGEPGRGMLETLSIFLHLGMPLEAVIAAATATPAALAGHPELGHLSPGAPADLAVLRLDREPVSFLDGAGNRIAAAARLTAQLTLKDGVPIWDAGGRLAPEWEKAIAERLEYRPGLALYRIGPRDGRSRPAILWIHGGGWTGGRPEMFLPAAAWTAEEGAVGFTVQYRLGSVGPAVEDVEAALVWIRAHAAELGVNPDRITAAGDSAGGHLALALATVTAARANAVLAYNPIPDLTGKWLDRTKGIDEARRLSPLFHIDARTPPGLLLHGTADTVVPPAESERFRDAFPKARLILYPGLRHAFIVPGYQALPAETGQAMRESFAWLREIGLLPKK